MTGLKPMMATSTIRAAMEARDVAAVVAAFAPDARFHSPLTDKLTFRGSEEIVAITEVILDVFGDLHYTDELAGGRSGFLVLTTQIGGMDIEIVDHLMFDENGKVTELTVFFRPLPAAAVALRVIGAGLGRRKSPARAALMSTLARPLGFMAKTGDDLGVRLVRAAL